MDKLDKAQGLMEELMEARELRTNLDKEAKDAKAKESFLQMQLMEYFTEVGIDTYTHKGRKFTPYDSEKWGYPADPRLRVAVDNYLAEQMGGMDAVDNMKSINGQRFTKVCNDLIEKDGADWGMPEGVTPFTVKKLSITKAK